MSKRTTRNTIKARGKVSVFPKDRKVLNKKKKPYEEQTIVINFSFDLISYYSNFLFKEKGIKLEHTSFGAHVTINNGKYGFDSIKHKEYLKSINNKYIEVEFDLNVYRFWQFLALKVVNYGFLNEIRQNLELPLRDDFHLTLGKLHPSHFKTNTKTLLTKTI